MTAANKIKETDDTDSDQMSAMQDDDLQDTDMDAYLQLNKELDEISNFLDALEEKNDSLHAEITKLLEESKQIRHEIKSETS